MKNPHRKRTSKLWRDSFTFVVLSAGVIVPPLALAVIPGPIFPGGHGDSRQVLGRLSVAELAVDSGLFRRRIFRGPIPSRMDVPKRQGETYALPLRSC